MISIQALYDYKPFPDINQLTFSSFQFKHCTIISVGTVIKKHLQDISIQALYDYKWPCAYHVSRCYPISIQALYDYKT